MDLGLSISIVLVNCLLGPCSNTFRNHSIGHTLLHLDWGGDKDDQGDDYRGDHGVYHGDHGDYHDDHDDQGEDNEGLSETSPSATPPFQLMWIRSSTVFLYPWLDVS